MKQLRLTDYFTCLDTLTVSEELVQDADHFFKLMALATNNQAFTCVCNFELKPTSANNGAGSSSVSSAGVSASPTLFTTSIEQPAWFKPKSFHTFATWVIVALEENLWAQ